MNCGTLGNCYVGLTVGGGQPLLVLASRAVASGTTVIPKDITLSVRRIQLYTCSAVMAKQRYIFYF